MPGPGKNDNDSDDNDSGLDQEITKAVASIAKLKKMAKQVKQAKDDDEDLPPKVRKEITGILQKLSSIKGLGKEISSKDKLFLRRFAVDFNYPLKLK